MENIDKIILSELFSDEDSIDESDELNETDDSDDDDEDDEKVDVSVEQLFLRNRDEDKNSEENIAGTSFGKTDDNSRPRKHKKSINHKLLYKQRAKALELKSKKVNILESIKNKYVANVDFQKSLKELIEVKNRKVMALEEKNEILQMKNDMMSRNNQLLERRNELLGSRNELLDRKNELIFEFLQSKPDKPS
ncbi:hypothetical protein PV327_008444 [Microctonus hyperodae]|uniref:Uncharacterized protein n=1 Tax=Microctonus hyperodae TaxID=165561 RepID=A0AA39F367_MICHY|nr:hypothetical protein PV327_008444 [Microctonus hyperodae]